MVFTEYELKAMGESPEMLREVAECHECQLTMADAIGFPFDYHDKRKEELLAEAARIESGY